MPTVSAGSSAVIDVAIGQKIAVSTPGEAYVDVVAGALGAGYTSKRLADNTKEQTFGPYGMVTRLNIRAIVGTATYGEAAEQTTNGGAVASVNMKVGNVELTAEDVGAVPIGPNPIDWYCPLVKNGDVLSTTALTAIGGTVEIGQSIIFKYANSLEGVGVWVIGAIDDDGLHTLTRHEDYPLGKAIAPLEAISLANGDEVLFVVFSPDGSLVLASPDTGVLGENPMDARLRRKNQGIFGPIGLDASASGLGSVASGIASTANGTSCLAFGRESTATGVDAIAIGNYSTASGEGSIASGFASIASGESSIASGKQSNTREITCAVAHSSGKFAVVGDAQKGLYVLRCATSNNTPTALCSDPYPPHPFNQVILPDNATYVFSGTVTAREGATGDSAAYTVTGCIKRGSGAASVSFVGSPTINTVAASSGATGWGVSVVADTTNGGLQIRFTGAAGKAIRAVGVVDTVEVAY